MTATAKLPALMKEKRDLNREIEGLIIDMAQTSDEKALAELRGRLHDASEELSEIDRRLAAS